MTGVGERITLDYDDEKAREYLRGLADRAGKLVPALDEIGKRLVTSVVHRFETETGPGGVSWKKSRRASEEKGQTLSDTGRLRSSITHRADTRGLTVGTNVVYAAIHQFGGKTPPRTIRPRRKKALFWPGARHPVASVNHPGSNIPARAFLGIDNDDRAMIRRVLHRHLEARP